MALHNLHNMVVVAALYTRFGIKVMQPNGGVEYGCDGLARTTISCDTRRSQRAAVQELYFWRHSCSVPASTYSTLTNTMF